MLIFEKTKGNIKTIRINRIFAKFGDKLTGNENRQNLCYDKTRCHRTGIWVKFFIINRAGFNIVAMKMTRLSADETKRFTVCIRGRTFREVGKYISSGAVVPLILEEGECR